MISRRKFIANSAALCGVAVLSGCSGDAEKVVPLAPTTTTTVSKTDEDLLRVSVLVGLENLIVNTYQMALDSATSNKLGVISPAVSTFLTTVQAQHKEYAQTLNAILVQAGKQKVSGINVTAKTVIVDSAIARMTDVKLMVNLALNLENCAAATYLNYLNAIETENIVKTIASIQPVVMQHASVLNYVLGNLPAPDVFAKNDSARPITDQIS